MTNIVLLIFVSGVILLAASLAEAALLIVDECSMANSGMAFAWYVWDRSHTGPTTIDRIAWESVS